MKRIVGVVLAIGLLFDTGVALAWSTQGAELLSTKENAIDVGMGYPEMRFQFHMPMSANLTIVPQFTFFYGYDVSAPVVGDGLFAGIRYRLYRSGGLHIAFQAEPGFILHYHPGGFGFGIQIGLPQILLSYRFNEKIVFDGGFKVPVAISVYPSPVVGSIPILFNMGLEVSIAPNLNLFYTMDVGPDILAASGGSVAQFRGVFLLGLAYHF